MLYEAECVTTRYRASPPPRGRDKVAPGGLLAAAPTVVHLIKRLIRDSADSGAQPGTQSPRPCLQVTRGRFGFHPLS